MVAGDVRGAVVVDEDVDPSLSGDDVVHEARVGLLVGSIKADELRHAARFANLIDDALRPLLIPRGKVDLGSLARESLRACQTDSSGRRRDCRDLAFDDSHVLPQSHS